MAAGGDLEALRLVEDILAVARDVACSTVFADGLIEHDRADCIGLARKMSLLVHLFEEIKVSANIQGEEALPEFASSSSCGGASAATSCLADLLVAVEISRRFLRIGRLYDGIPVPGAAATESLGMNADEPRITTVAEQLQYVSWQLDKALGNLNYEHFNVSSEVVEQVELVRAQLRRVSKRAEPQALDSFSQIYSSIRHESDPLRDFVDPVNGSEECKKPPADFLCPISLDLMKDPVVVSTGQTYERSSIQRWIDSGNLSCPKTQQKLQNLVLTPNYALRSLISNWCEVNGVDWSGQRVQTRDPMYQDLVRRLSTGSVPDQRAAASEIRSMARRSTENRIRIAESGAIPVLVKLLSAADPATQEHAVTSLLNLSICNSNKTLIVLSGAVGPIVGVLRGGTAEARENAAFALFSLSLDDENKVVIGAAPGVFEALVELLRAGSARGRRDAATALFNLCIYAGNKARAVRAGVLGAAAGLMEETGAEMVEEAVALMSVVVGNREGKAAAARANAVPLLVEVLRGGRQPQVKENAAAVLLALCKKNAEGLGVLERLGAEELLRELAESGTDRARRKAKALLGQLSKVHGPVH